MKIWLPYVASGSGSDTYTTRIAKCLRASGWEVEATKFPHVAELWPWAMNRRSRPPGTDVVLANSWNAFAFVHAGVPLVVVAHHCVLDPALSAYQTISQNVYHRTLVRAFEQKSFRVADLTVAVSQYTAKMLRAHFKIGELTVIPNGIEVDEWSPPDAVKEPIAGRRARLLFVGNLSRRKGADLLPRIMTSLGSDYELVCVSGLRNSTHLHFQHPNITIVSNLSEAELREYYRRADVLVFPSRLEGFGYAVVEAMACGTPVVATKAASLPEIVESGKTGILCERDDIGCFVSAIRQLCESQQRLQTLGENARIHVSECFSISKMAERYDSLLRTLLR